LGENKNHGSSIGRQKQILDLSVRNAKFTIEQLKQLQIVDQIAIPKVMAQMQDLRLPVEPRHIECFDNKYSGNQSCCGLWYLRMENQVEKTTATLI
jgi:excinuclease ABC subunit C